MQTKAQPWIHSWFGDLLCLHSMPWIFILLAWFKLPPFGINDNALLMQMVFAVLIIDWAHIFAQWHRIYSNPLEKNHTKKKYLFSYLLLIPLLTVILHFGARHAVNVFLIYFVIFHFIKQAFGFIKIYSHIDGPKSRIESTIETSLIYFCMWTPVIYWHQNFPKPDFSWAYFFIKNTFINYLFWPALFGYLFCFVGYIYFEFKRWKEKGIINIPKNIALFSSALGWAAVSFLPENKVLIMFTVVLAHDLSYTFFVWFIGRRDENLLTGKVRWISWWSMPGFIVYVVFLILISHPIMVLYLEMARDLNMDYWLIGKIFNDAPSSNSWWKNLGWAIFFSTQGHHYFIDRYLWKKEKDLNYMMKSGRYKIENVESV